MGKGTRRKQSNGSVSLLPQDSSDIADLRGHFLQHANRLCLLKLSSSPLYFFSLTIRTSTSLPNSPTEIILHKYSHFETTVQQPSLTSIRLCLLTRHPLNHPNDTEFRLPIWKKIKKIKKNISTISQDLHYSIDLACLLFTIQKIYQP